LNSKGTILITGATGFVGSHLVNRLLSLGYLVLATVRDLDQCGNHPIIRHSISQKNLILFQSDWEENPLVLEKAISKFKIDGLINCVAKQPRPNLGLKDYEKVNVHTLKNIFEFASRIGSRVFITFSSATVYAPSLGTLIHEGSPVNPVSDYAKSKLKGELMLSEISAHLNLATYNFRLPSVYGYGQEGGIAHTYYVFAKAHESIEVYSNGKLIRNILYIDDLANLCETVLSKPAKNGYCSYLFGSKNSLSMEAIAGLFVKYLSSRSRILLVEKEAPVPLDWNLDLTKIQKDLRAKSRTIEEGVKDYIQAMEMRS